MAGNTPRLFEETKVGGSIEFVDWEPGNTAWNYKEFYQQKHGHLYIMKCGEFVKVGRAKDPKGRLQSVQGANPYEVELLYTRKVPLGGCPYGEAYAHDQLKEFLHRGEWFTCAPEVARRAVDRAVLRADLYDCMSAQWEGY